MRLVFLGSPGAGKGTMAALLDQRLKVKHLSSGDILREAAHRSDAMGKAIGDYIRSGSLVPDGLVTELMVRHLGEFRSRRDFVLDGFPRTVEQARTLDHVLTDKAQAPIDLAVDFKVAAQTVVSRLAGRRICEKCGANYHVERLAPTKPGVCDRCGGALVSRADDEPATIIKRLEIYHTQTEPLLDFYRAQGKLTTVSGELQIEEQFQELLKALQEKHLVNKAG